VAGMVLTDGVPPASSPPRAVDAVGATPLVRLQSLGTKHQVLAKLEFLNPFGSSKDRVARYVVPAALKTGVLRPGGTLIESTSGNFGIALASVALAHDVKVTCVVDPNILPLNRRILHGLGVELEVVREPDRHGNYLEARLRRVQELLLENPSAYWVNQYENAMCVRAHYETTAEEILQQSSSPADVLVVGISTGATLMGLASRLREAWPALRVCAVDAAGSSALGGRNGRRTLPGLGMSRASRLVRPEDVDEVLYVTEDEALAACRALLAREGLLAGASSGAVVAAVAGIASRYTEPKTIVTLLPDRGERYTAAMLPDPEERNGARARA
jgi:N-(2-amino-2-carboxyethyl)-L-glutamate synthase